MQGLIDNERQTMSKTEVLVWKGTLCQKVSGTGSYDFYFMIMVIKHAEQTTMKQQKNKVLPQCLSECRYNKNRNSVNIIWILPFVQIQRQKEMLISCNIITQPNCNFQSTAQGGVYKWWRKRFSLQQHSARSYYCTWRQCWWNPIAFR